MSNVISRERAIELFRRVAYEEASWPPPPADELNYPPFDETSPLFRNIELWRAGWNGVRIVEALFVAWNFGRWARAIEGDEEAMPRVWFFRPVTTERRDPQFVAFAFGNTSQALPMTVARFLEGAIDAPELLFRLEEAEIALGLSCLDAELIRNDYDGVVRQSMNDAVTVVHDRGGFVLIPIVYDADVFPDEMKEMSDVSWEDVFFRHNAVIREWFSLAAWRDVDDLFGGREYVSSDEYIPIVRDAVFMYGKGCVSPEVMNELEAAVLEVGDPSITPREEWPELVSFVEDALEDGAPTEQACAELIRETFYDLFPDPFIPKGKYFTDEEREAYVLYESQRPRRRALALKRLIASSLKGFLPAAEDGLQVDLGLEALVAKLIFPHIDRITGWNKF